MTAADDQLRDPVARQLDELLTGELATDGDRATVRLSRYFQRNGAATQQRERLWVEIQARYLARQSGVERDGRAALLTAGAPVPASPLPCSCSGSSTTAGGAWTPTL